MIAYPLELALDKKGATCSIIVEKGKTKMENSFHYVLTFINGADVDLDNDCFYHYECYGDVCFGSDGKGDVHYNSLPLDKAGRRVIE